MPPIFVTAIITSLAALIPKAVTDLYDYAFNGEEIQVKKVPDRTKFNTAQVMAAKDEYKFYLDANDDLYSSQQELTDGINTLLRTSKSVPQMMRICRSDS